MEERAVVLYESPHRLMKLLGEIQDVFGDIHISVSRELTKYFEETRRGRVSQVRAHFTHSPPKGELTVVITRDKRYPSKGESDVLAS